MSAAVSTMGLFEGTVVKIIVGLGNIGQKYECTRHNVGFEVLDELKKRLSLEPQQKKFDGKYVKFRVAECSAILLWPETYMNNSGRSVAAAAKFFKTPLDSVLLVCDDLSLPTGKLRMRKSGSSGGQKGLKDTIDQLGSQDFPRLRIGIGEAPGNWETADYVLGKFSKSERTTMDLAIIRSADAILCWLNEGIDSAMNNFNRD